MSMISRIIKRSMSSNTFSRMLNNAEAAEKRLLDLKSQLQELKNVKIEEKIRQLTAENKVLVSKVESAKAELIKLEISHGKKQYLIPSKVAAAAGSQGSSAKIIDQEAVKKKKVQDLGKAAASQEPRDLDKVVKDQDSAKKVKEPAKKKAAESAADAVIDVRKLDLRIGKIVDINKHPDADTLYVEKIDCGEVDTRTVVSGLVNHVPIEEMRDRIVMVLCNLKPVKMRGVTSQAMVMCASSPDKVEVLIPPSGSVPGDLVQCEGYPREPEPVLNPKKKIFETCAPDLKTNDDKVACYKGSPLVVPGKGPVLAATLKGVNVK